MGELRRVEVEGGLYERLLQRLALALEEAETAQRWRDERPGELELRGLSSAEVALINAYLDHDLSWLSGWHAAAEELALIERRALRPLRPQRNGVRAGAARTPGVKSSLKRRRQLCCALCGTPANWQPGLGVQGCETCGSQLFRTQKPR
ncbi:hypothetical protein [Zestomonas carbonaria]|uniref:Uncharacterized protein n=1 Tax=Zestomonas carbonaria TaxID=2762745 RepID=A0A7U7EM92_9GAMM|nr:hypothetical protein [Pseudomonas carbonaria]CAD5107618.1 hypothetical protein PSEWESI4_01891 [Pseudomonas carbonaria]